MAQVLLEVQAVDLDYRAVAAVVQVIFGLEPLLVEVHGLFGGGYAAVVGVRLEAHLRQEGQPLPVSFRNGAFGPAEAVYEDVQGTLGCEPWVELAQRAGGGVAGVGVRWEALLSPLFIEALEGGLREQHLAARLEPGGRAGPNAQRHASDGAQVQRYVFAGGAVAASRAAHEHAVLVGEGDGEAVVLELADKIEVAALQRVCGAAVPRHELVFVEGVAEAEQRHGVAHLLEAARRLGADALRGRVRRDEVRVLCFQSEQLVQQRVELGVADLRLVPHVVQVVVPVDLRAGVFQYFRLRAGRSTDGGLHSYAAMVAAACNGLKLRGGA